MTKRKSVSAEEARIEDAGAVPLFKSTEPVKPSGTGGRDEAEYNRRYGKPTTYRLPEELRDRIKAVAAAEGVGLSELAAFILARFVADYDAGKVQIPKERQDVYSIDFDALDR